MLTLIHQVLQVQYLRIALSVLVVTQHFQFILTQEISHDTKRRVIIYHSRMLWHNTVLKQKARAEAMHITHKERIQPFHVTHTLIDTFLHAS